MPGHHSQPKRAPNGAEETSGSRTSLTMKAIPETDRPRERLVRCGGDSLADAELIAILLRSGRPGLSAIDMGRQILDEAGGLVGLLRVTEPQLRREGLRRAKATTVLAAVELGRRLARAQLVDREILSSPAAVARYVALRYARCDHEVMGGLYLDVRRRLIAEAELYRGTLSRTAVEPRAILKQALLHSASSFILFHTHPSGDPTPSAEDLAFTRRMQRAGELVGVPLADHLVVGAAGQWVSLHRRRAW